MCWIWREGHLSAFRARGRGWDSPAQQHRIVLSHRVLSLSYSRLRPVYQLSTSSVVSSSHLLCPNSTPSLNMSPPLPLPPSYAGLTPSLPENTLSHHPSDSPTVTPVIVLTLSRPQKNNAFTNTMQQSLVQAFDMLGADDRVKAIVVAGKGRMFCAGADLDIGLKRMEGAGAREHRDG